MKRIFIFPICLILSISVLAACGGNIFTEQTTQSNLSEEALKLSGLTINDNDILLPVSYAEFKEKTGFDINNARPEEVSDKDTLAPGETSVSQIDTSDGVFDILVENRSEKELAISECHVIAIKLMRLYKKDCDLSFSYQGLKWDSSVDDIKKALGEPATEDTKVDYHLLGYSFKRDETSNISVSFVADSDKIDSFAISIDYIGLS